MTNEAETRGTEGGLVDDHPTNPAFYVHANEMLASIERASFALPAPAHQAVRDSFLFLYFLILDLDRKFMYLHRLNQEYFKNLDARSLSPKHRELLTLVAQHHEQIWAAKPDLCRMVETLERITHELWAGHQEEWHAKMEELTGVPLTPHDDTSNVAEVHAERRARFLECKPRRRWNDDADSDHHHERRLCAAAAGPRRAGDPDDTDYGRNGERRPRGPR